MQVRVQCVCERGSYAPGVSGVRHHTCLHRTYVLKRGAVGSSGTASTGGHETPLLPLWGQICCKLMAQPDCATESRMTGFINVQVGLLAPPTIPVHAVCCGWTVTLFLLPQRMVSGLPDWMRLWCVMRQNRMRCWKNPEDVGRKMPEQVIELSEVQQPMSETNHHQLRTPSLSHRV